MTLLDYGKKFANELKENQSLKNAEKIAYKIMNLSYEDSNESLTNADKDALIQIIKNECRNKKTGTFLLNSSNNSDLLSLIDYVSELINAKED